MADITAKILDDVFSIIQTRKAKAPDSSYSARCLARGKEYCAQKFGEESVETIIAALGADQQAILEESADTLYHLLLLWTACDIKPEQIYAVLAQRKGKGGIAPLS